MIQVFCVHSDTSGTLLPGVEEGHMVVGEKKDTRVLAVILLGFSVVFLVAGAVIALCQNKKRRRHFLKNIQKNVASRKKEDMFSCQEECIEWSSKL